MRLISSVAFEASPKYRPSQCKDELKNEKKGD
jgi:hypothetical protein